MRLHDAVVPVRNFVHAFAAVVHHQRVQALHAFRVVRKRLHQIVKPELLLSQRFVTPIQVKARQVLLLRPVVLRQRHLVPANGVLRLAAVAIAVGTIKSVALVQGVLGLNRLRVRRFQKQGVLQILIGVLVARPAAPRHHAVVAVQNAGLVLG